MDPDGYVSEIHQGWMWDNGKMTDMEMYDNLTGNSTRVRRLHGMNCICCATSHTHTHKHTKTSQENKIKGINKVDSSESSDEETNYLPNAGECQLLELTIHGYANLEEGNNK